MIAEIHVGEESWIKDVTGEPRVTFYGGTEWELEFPTKHGTLSIMLTPGDPCEFDADELRAALERARLAREAKL